MYSVIIIFLVRAEFRTFASYFFPLDRPLISQWKKTDFVRKKILSPSYVLVGFEEKKLILTYTEIAVKKYYDQDNL